MVAAGEAGGILDTIFQRLAVYIEKAVKLKRAVQSAMVYPIAVVLIAAGVITLILWKVVPQFTILFESMNVDLPLADAHRDWRQQVRRKLRHLHRDRPRHSRCSCSGRITGPRRDVTLLTE